MTYVIENKKKQNPNQTTTETQAAASVMSSTGKVNFLGGNTDTEFNPV